jgi:isopentenyl-diphosphate delta-isomerase
MAAKGLGADVAGMALPFFRAQQTGGLAGAEESLEEVVTGLKHALVLSGCQTIAALRAAPKVLTGELKDWIAALAAEESR